METSLVYPPPPSLFINSMAVLSFAGLAMSGLSEVRGKHLQYSKFSTSRPPTSKQLLDISISSKTGMLWLYSPALAAASASFYAFPSDDLRFLLLKSALGLHFFKRVFEVMFIHKYSGSMTVDAVIPITLSYFTATAMILYTHQLLLGLPGPAFDLKYAGVLVFAVGMVGNLYHHILLAKLRGSEGDKQYKIPKGGLFGKVICPHYLFEIMVFWGFFLISQNIYALSVALGTTIYLMGRSYATRRWYVNKFEDFPDHIKALIPFVF